MVVYFPTSVFLPVIPRLHLFPASDTGTQCHLVVPLYFGRLWVVPLCNDSMLQVDHALLNFLLPYSTLCNVLNATCILVDHYVLDLYSSSPNGL